MEETKGVGSIVKTLKILDCLSKDEAEIGVTALSQMLDIPKPTVVRLITVLQNYGYVEQNVETKKYRLGLKLFYLGTVVLKRLEVRDKALPIMHKLKEQTGESVYLNVVRDDKRMCLEVVRSIHDLQALITVGQRSPLYAGASAKVLLAFMGEAKRNKTIEKLLFTPLTAKTVTNPEKLQEELADIREKGYALTFGERVQGVVSVSAPIWNYSGEVLSSLSISIPDVRADQSKIGQTIDLLKDAAQQISSAMGYQPA